MLVHSCLKQGLLMVILNDRIMSNDMLCFQNHSTNILLYKIP